MLPIVANWCFICGIVILSSVARWVHWST